MSKIPISEALTLINVSKTTLYRDINNGKVSATKDAVGRKVIDIAELARVYGDFVSPPHAENGTREKSHQGNMGQNGTGGNGKNIIISDASATIVAVLEEQVALLKTQLERAETKLENAAARENKLLDMLSVEQEKTKQLMLPPPDNDKPKPNFFRRLFNF